MSKKSSGGGFIQLFIQVAEKLIRAAIQATIQCIKWLWQAGNWSHREYLSLRGYSQTNPAPAIERVVAALAILVVILLFLMYGLPMIFH